ncbi:MAG: peptide chain release factor N(5)-glutamine methyltransferase [Tissierellia bacterium]|nr:peptide chain release factor N(5)-glutamine methyltransferase [Tissierellia bacterium]
MVVKEAVKWGSKELEAVSLDPSKEAYWILGDLLDKAPLDLMMEGERPLDKKTESKFSLIISQRKEGMPLAYIQGKQAFMGFDFYVNNKVLIPRQDTERSVEALLDLAQSKKTFLELGVGSGCVSISLSLLAPKAIQVDGVDISREALEVAKKNKKALGARGVSFWQSDLFLKVSHKYDVIYSNPPYISYEDYETLEASVRKYEPALALVAHKDGLEFYEKIVSQARDYLNPQGRLVFEIGYNQKEALSQILEDHGFRLEEVIYDYNHLPRVVLAS